jgi:intein/homing endonuclease
MTIKVKHTFTFFGWSKPLAYLVGVYLSDGSVHHPNGRMAIFTHSSIDKEFVDKTDSALRLMLPTTTVRRRIMKRTIPSATSLAKRFTSEIYEVTVSNNDFGLWLESVTKNKTIVPDISDRYLIHLLSGFIDGDGYINKFQDKKRPQLDRSFLKCYQVGICGKGKKMIKLVEAFTKMGVKVGTKTIGKREVETYKLNLGSLTDSKICFSIHRKFYKFCEYVNQVKPSTTIRRTLVYTSDDIV